MCVCQQLFYHYFLSVGQFWNIPVDIRPFTGMMDDGSEASGTYVVTLNTGGSQRSYTGYLSGSTWDHTQEPCLYVGNRQAGQIFEISNPNDPVIASIYKDYRVEGAYSEENYLFGLFNEDNCNAGAA